MVTILLYLALLFAPQPCGEPTATADPRYQDGEPTVTMDPAQRRCHGNRLIISKEP